MRLFPKLLTLLLLLGFCSSFCFAETKEERRAKETARLAKEHEEEKKAFYNDVEATKERLKKDSLFIQLTKGYDIFKKYAVTVLAIKDHGRETIFSEASRDSMMEEYSKAYTMAEKSGDSKLRLEIFGKKWDLERAKRRWAVKMDDPIKQAAVMDSINALNHPFFERIHQRSEAVCKDKILQNDTLKELSQMLLAWYTKTGRNDYFVERTGFRYTTKPCKKKEKSKKELFEDTLFFGFFDDDDDCEFQDLIDIDTLCVDTRGTKFKRLFLTDEDKKELDVFSGCDRWRGSMKEDDDRYNKDYFLPVEISLNSHDMCFDYGAEWFSQVFLDLENGEAALYGGCISFMLKKNNGIWQYMNSNVHCFN